MLLSHVRYHRWATSRLLDSIENVDPLLLNRDLGNSFPSTWNTVEHLFQADSIWSARLEGRITGKLSDFQAPTDITELRRAWLERLDQWPSWASAPDRVVTYRNTQGKEFEHSVQAILLHAINHGTYHRGQVATMLRQLGQRPLGTDLILFYRDNPENAMFAAGLSS